MSRLTVVFLVGVVPLLVSCASSRKVAVLEPVGPAPLAKSTASAATDGTLQVFSLRGVFNAEGVNYHPHTDYTIYTSNGQRLKEIKNKVYPYDEEPAPVSLPAGNYTVEALAKGYARVRVPVIVEAGRVTSVDLESNKRPEIAKAK